MKKRLTFVLILITVTITAFLAVLYIRDKSLILDILINKEVGLGNVSLNSKREFDIPLTNLTGKDFEIAKVYTSCGCTKVVGEESGITSFTIKSKETMKVKLEFDPSSMHQKGDLINHEVYFLITSPIEKEYKVKITGKVI